MTEWGGGSSHGLLGTAFTGAASVSGHWVEACAWTTGTNYCETEHHTTFHTNAATGQPCFEVITTVNYGGVPASAVDTDTCD